MNLGPYELLAQQQQRSSRENILETGSPGHNMHSNAPMTPGHMMHSNAPQTPGNMHSNALQTSPGNHLLSSTPQSAMKKSTTLPPSGRKPSVFKFPANMATKSLATGNNESVATGNMATSASLATGVGSSMSVSSVDSSATDDTFVLPPPPPECKLIMYI